MTQDLLLSDPTTLDLYHPPRRQFREEIEWKDEKTKDHRLQALADSHALSKKPLFFRVRGFPRYLYTINNFGAATKAVNLTAPHQLARTGSLQAELTRKRIVPLVESIKKSGEAEKLLDALRLDDDQAVRVFREDLGYDIRSYVRLGLLNVHNVNPYRHTGRALGRSTVYLPQSPVLVTQSSLRGPDGLKHLYNVPAVLEAGMNILDCTREESYQCICDTIHQNINNISLELSSAMYSSVRPKVPFRNYRG
jgi:hypothetical protein